MFSIFSLVKVLNNDRYRNTVTSRALELTNIYNTLQILSSLKCQSDLKSNKNNYRKMFLQITVPNKSFRHFGKFPPSQGNLFFVVVFW